MSIIILAQSLKNDGTGDVQIDGNFAPPPEKLRLLDEFYENGRKMNFEKCEIDGIKVGRISSISTIGRITGFMITGEEKDSVGRNSPICIQAKRTELSYVIQHLEDFLKRSGRTVSEGKKKILREKIDFEMNACDTPMSKFWLYAAGGIVALIVLVWLVCFDGKAGN